MLTTKELTSKFEIDNVEFVIDTSPGYHRRPSEENSFTLVKSPPVLNYYYNLAKRKKINNIFEIGVFQGGSFVLLDKLFSPQNIIGVEIAESFTALEKYCSDQIRNVNVYFNTSQTDECALNSIMDVDFPNGIDLVVDDASHTYANTKRTFELVFPKLVAGGTYIIEDWAWAHKAGMQDKGHSWHKDPAMTNLLFELIVDIGTKNSIQSISIDAGKAIVVKGQGKKQALKDNLMRDRQLSLI